MIDKITEKDLGRKVVQAGKTGVATDYDDTNIMVNFGEGPVPVEPKELEWAPENDTGVQIKTVAVDEDPIELTDDYEAGDEVRIKIADDKWAPAVLTEVQAGGAQFRVRVPAMGKNTVIVKKGDIRKVRPKGFVRTEGTTASDAQKVTAHIADRYQTISMEIADKFFSKIFKKGDYDIPNVSKIINEVENYEVKECVHCAAHTRRGSKFCSAECESYYPNQMSVHPEVKVALDS